VTDVTGLQTPALIVERERLDANIARMEQRCRDLGVRLRPHVKTAKSAEIGGRTPSAVAHGITVSTVKEAEYFGAHAFTDQLYAVTVVPSRLPRLAALRRRGVQVRLAVDSEAAVTAVAEFGAREGVTFDVLLEVDSGEHRSGLSPDDDELARLAERLDRAAATRFAGVFTHAGHGYHCRTAAELRAVAEQERAAVVAAAERIGARGVECAITSVGSTPTATHAEHLSGVSEVRAGVYVFGDVFQASLGTCRLDDVAASVLTAVIGHQRQLGRLVIDAGALALSKDRSTAALGPERDAGYGLVCDVDLRPLPGARVAAVYQEHGLVEIEGGVDFGAFPLGHLLRVLPNHACITAAAYDRYRVVHDRTVEATWGRVNEWT